MLRLDAGRAHVRFTWPEPAVLTLIAWDDGVRREELRVPRSAHQVAGGAVTVAVPDTACTVTLVPLPRPDAVALPAAPVHVALPAATPPPPPPLPARWSWWRRWLRRPAARAQTAGRP